MTLELKVNRVFRVNRVLLEQLVLKANKAYKVRLVLQV